MTAVILKQELQTGEMQLIPTGDWNMERKNLECGNCDYKTHRKTALWHHREHYHNRKEKQYNCNKCDYGSRFITELKRHETKMHNTGENLLKCDKCLYETTTKRNLKRHNEWKHEEHQLCELCPFSGCKSSVTEHMKNKHGKLENVPFAIFKQP